MKNYTLILEAGVNHNNSIENAVRLIESASKTGADYIKFQTYSAHSIASKNSPSYWDLKEEPTKSQFELFSKYDNFTFSDYELLSETCKQNKIGFMSTCFDIQWAEKLNRFQSIHKIASADITNFQLIEKISSFNKKIILSTGAASFREITNAIDLIQKNTSSDIVLLHCVLNYPTELHHANLGRISKLKMEFPEFELGLSDHSKVQNSILIGALAYALGARVFEKHFTLDKTLKGNDHYHSFDENDVVNFINNLLDTQKILSFEEGNFLGIQTEARIYARRGLYLTRSLTKGHKLQFDDLIPLRPSSLNGVKAENFFEILGKTLNSDLEEGHMIRPTDLSD